MVSDEARIENEIVCQKMNRRKPMRLMQLQLFADFASMKLPMLKMHKQEEYS
jgi:hypothetical protein